MLLIMKLSPEQDKAIKFVTRWAKYGETPFFRLFGYAGTGKTTIAKLIAQNCGKVGFAAFTGKAAHVLEQAGCLGATTIHRLIYNPKDRCRARLRDLQQELQSCTDPKDKSEIELDIKAEQEKLKKPAFTLNPDSPVKDMDLLIIDEASMIDQWVAKDLLSFGTKVLVLGDPAQLPPVKGTGFFMTEKPEVILTQIHRQAKNSPIIQLATMIREGRRPEIGSYGDSEVIDWGDVDPEDAIKSDQILVGKNSTRRGTNKRIRELTGISTDPLPVEGDRLVCLRNNHDLGILNGSIWYVQSTEERAHTTRHIGLALSQDPEVQYKEEALFLHAHTAPFLGMQLNFWEARDFEEFDYGYALTCHKAQGSQWPNVMIFDESKTFGVSWRSWLYTAVTRASERVVLVV